MEIKDKELHRVASTAIIYKKDVLPSGEVNKYLILKRALSKKTFPGRWTLPGGGLTIDDYVNTPKTTPDAWYYVLGNSLRREIREETALEVEKLDYLLDLTFISPNGTPIVVLSWYGPWKSGEVKLNDESIDYKWVTPEESKNYDLIEGISEEMQMVDKILCRSNG